MSTTIKTLVTWCNGCKTDRTFHVVGFKTLKNGKTKYTCRCEVVTCNRIKTVREEDVK